jgi:DNA polymerase-3 subunit delta'
MHAYLIIGEGEEKSRLKAKSLAEKESALFIENPLKKIEDVRELGKILKLKRSQKTLFFIPNIENSTAECLNSFLKLLEEPKANNIFVMSSRSESLILPTILSRAQIIRLSQNTSDENGKESEDLINILSDNIVKRLGIVDKYKKREDALKFLEKLIYFIHKKIITTPDADSVVKKIKIVNTAYSNIKDNGNPTIQLINLAVNS